MREAYAAGFGWRKSRPSSQQTGSMQDLPDITWHFWKFAKQQRKKP